jgi:hypothetical protein
MAITLTGKSKSEGSMSIELDDEDMKALATAVAKVMLGEAGLDPDDTKEIVHTLYQPMLDALLPAMDRVIDAHLAKRETKR